MSIHLMRRIDFWIGLPLTWILTRLTARPCCLNDDRVISAPPRRVICSKFLGMGSIVLSLPLLKLLKDSGVKIVFWSFEANAELLVLSGYADNILTIRSSLIQFLPSLWKSWREARRFRAEVFLDLEPTANFSALLAWASGAKIRAGFMTGKPNRERLLTHRIALNPGEHMVKNYFSLAHLLGFNIKEAATSLPEPPAILVCSFPSRSLRRHVVININSSDLSKQRMWQDSNWLVLCLHLLQYTSLELIFPGSHSEHDHVESLLSQLNHHERARNLAGRTSFIDLARLLQSAQFVISVDSGIMHLAAWMRAPLIALFGPETPTLYGPRSPNAIILSAGLFCSPCLQMAREKLTHCRDNQCMAQITPQMVLEACAPLLSISITKKYTI